MASVIDMGITTSFIPVDIIRYIGQYLSLRELIRMEQINKFFKNLIRSTTWHHLTIEWVPWLHKWYKMMNFILSTYHFTKHDFSFVSINNKHLALIRDCCWISIYGCQKITGKGLKYLVNYREVELGDCGRVDDKHLQYLSKCSVVKLSNLPHISSEGIIKHLQKCHELAIIKCRNVSLDIFKSLPNCHHFTYQKLGDQIRWIFNKKNNTWIIKQRKYFI